jgi:phage-related baseplate assembly protein
MTDRIDLSKLSIPDVVETLDFEEIYQEQLAEFRVLYPDWTAILESDPVVKLLELAAYREMLLRARVNDAARAVMLAYAGGADLDHLAALLAVHRLDGEPDARLRARAQLSLESISTAGPTLAYVYHAMSASADVRDVSVYSPSPGDVVITVLSEPSEAYPDGIPDAGLLQAVKDKVSANDVRPLTDHVNVVPAEIIHYSVQAGLYLPSMVGSDIVVAESRSALSDYVEQQFLLGHDITLSGLFAALHRPGVTRVDLLAPTDNLIVAPSQVARCDSITVTVAGVEI